MGTVTPPANQMAKSTRVHSYEVRDMTATVSPGSRPPAIRPLARALTSCRNFCAEMSTQPLGPFRRYRAWAGLAACCSSSRSVTLLLASSSTSSSVLASLTAGLRFRCHAAAAALTGLYCHPALDPGRHPHPDFPVHVGDDLGGPDRVEECRQQDCGGQVNRHQVQAGAPPPGRVRGAAQH